MVTMREVALRAGVTKQTVSNVLNRPEIVSPQTAEQVRRAIAELGFSPNLVARGLATGRTRIIGLLVPTTDHPFYGAMVEEIEDRLNAAGFGLLLSTTRGDAARGRRQIDALASRAIDGLIVAGDTDVELYVSHLDEAPFPYVLCAWEVSAPQGACISTIDYVEAGTLAGRHVAELGHKSAAIVADLPAHGRRASGMVAALEERGVAVEVLSAGGGTVAAGRLVGAQVLAGPARPSAVIASNDLLALGVLDAARDAGLQVPGMLSVVGIDDAAARLGHSELTSVALPVREMAAEASKQILESLSSTVVLGRSAIAQPHLVVRRTSAAPTPAQQSEPLSA